MWDKYRRDSDVRLLFGAKLHKVDVGFVLWYEMSVDIAARQLSIGDRHKVTFILFVVDVIEMHLIFYYKRPIKSGVKTTLWYH